MNDWNLKGRTPVQYRRIRNFIDELRRAVFSATIGFQATYARSPEAMPLAKTFTLVRNPVTEGEVWGRTWDSGYFHLQGVVPPGWEGKPLAAWLDLGGEALVYSATGEPLWSLTNGSAFDREYSKDVYRIGPAGAPGSKVELWIEAAANHLFGIDRPPQGADRAATDRFGTWEARVQRLRLGLFDEPTWHLALDLTVLIDLWERLDPESPRAARILAGAFEATTLWHGDPARSNLVRAHLRALWDRPAVPSAQATTAVGHAHIDTAWLWPLAETRRKVARTFASQLNLIERYPGYVFGASAPQHHQWVKEDHPALWARIQRAVAQGRWEPQGGMWIEADCNLPSGESLVRQVLHGKNFWRDEFGVDVKTCWIPDVFGYTPALPQILKKAGIDFFLTQKLSWSKFNTFPHDTFRWRGLDGSEVVTHFPPEDTYNSYGTPEGLVRAEKAFAEKAFLDEFLTLVGIGDGGGGPKEEHLEHLLRAQNTEGLPRVSLGGANGFFERLAPNRDRLEVWDGELYLEYHRGTFTTQARTKQNHRRLEQTLVAVEALWAQLPLDQWPRREFDSATKTLLLHEFHDILPGSSIGRVYQDADRAFAQAFSLLDRLVARAADLLLPRSPGTTVFFNSLGVPWRGLVDDGKGDLVPLEIPALGWAQIEAGEGVPAREDGDSLVLENSRVRFRFDPDARLVEAWDRIENRPLLPLDRPGNGLTLYEDTPHNFDAWDIDYYYPRQKLEEARGLGHRRIDQGQAGRTLRFDLAIGQSTLVQSIHLGEDDQLTFETEVEWHESHRLLRTSFPHGWAVPEARCETAWGHVWRPTHRNTEWDFAKFEVCAHRWVDVGGPRGGLALLNDGKYGHSVQDQALGLSLLRSPREPDPDADQGHHRFTYALVFRHTAFEDSDVIERAARLNRPPLRFEGRLPGAAPGWSFSGRGYSVEALKKAEKEEAWIVRVVENLGLEASVAFTPPGEGPWTITQTDLLEGSQGPVCGEPGQAQETLGRFEARTWKVRRPGP